jgi:two-component system KDP operon response regulator KdpE
MAAIYPTILMIEDEEHIRRFLRHSLESQDFRLIESSTGAEGLTLAASHNPDVILLDLGLPDMDGLEVLQRCRSWNTTPIIILSARGKDQDKIHALEIGADDYLIKPFSIGELTARVKVALRHSNRPNPASIETVFKSGGLMVDMEEHRVTLNDIDVHLTPKEFKLLAILVRKAGKLVTWKELLGDIWGPAGGDSTHYLRIYISQLRHKLEENPARPRYLITEAGIGYRLNVGQ